MASKAPGTLIEVSSIKYYPERALERLEVHFFITKVQALFLMTFAELFLNSIANEIG